jgi:hypothetical protein
MRPYVKGKPVNNMGVLTVINFVEFYDRPTLAIVKEDTTNVPGTAYNDYLKLAYLVDSDEFEDRWWLTEFPRELLIQYIVGEINKKELFLNSEMNTVYFLECDKRKTDLENPTIIEVEREDIPEKYLQSMEKEYFDGCIQEEDDLIDLLRKRR